MPGSLQITAYDSIFIENKYLHGVFYQLPYEKYQ